MDTGRTGVFVLFVLVLLVSSKEIFFTDPVICYFLDVFLVVYCIAATALLFREKFSHSLSAARAPAKQDDGGIYQELERPKDADPYQVLQPSKGKKKNGKKKKSEPVEAEEKNAYEALMPSGSAPAPPPPQ